MDDTHGLVSHRTPGIHAVFPFEDMHVGPADRSSGNLKERVGGPHLRHGLLPELNPAGLDENRGFHAR